MSIYGNDYVTLSNIRVKSPIHPGGGGGGYSVWTRILTAVRPLASVCCHDLQWLKKKGGGAALILYCRIGELSELVQLIVHVK